MFINDFGVRSVPPCSDCDSDGHCTMNCSPASSCDDPHETIKRLRAIIGQIETVLIRDSAAKDQSGNIDKRNFVGKAILLCRQAKMGNL